MPYKYSKNPLERTPEQDIFARCVENFRPEILRSEAYTNFRKAEGPIAMKAARDNFINWMDNLGIFKNDLVSSFDEFSRDIELLDQWGSLNNQIVESQGLDEEISGNKAWDCMSQVVSCACLVIKDSEIDIFEKIHHLRRMTRIATNQKANAVLEKYGCFSESGHWARTTN